MVRDLPGIAGVLVCLCLTPQLSHAFDLRAISATTPDAHSVSLEYEVTGQPMEMGSVSIGVWRSADTTFDPGSDTLIATTSLTDASEGSHTQVVAVPDSGLAINPSLPNVLVVLDAPTVQLPTGAFSETDETNNVAAMRKLAFAVVIHGLTSLDAPPDWVGLMGDALITNGYNGVLEADWTTLSRAPDPTAPAQFASELLPLILDDIAALGLDPDDRVDLHWIGHSRGAVVISEALQLIAADANWPESISGGWSKVTFLDPHPAKNRIPEQMSVNTLVSLGPILGKFTRAFQQKTSDPDVVLPPNSVDASELYYQHGEWYTLSPQEVFYDWLANYWGETLPNVAIDQRFDITRPRLSHFEVPNYYVDEVLLAANKSLDQKSQISRFLKFWSR